MNNSRIFKQKTKFFLYRIVSYFSFLLIPLWIQKTLSLKLGSQVFLMGLYILFLSGQWYLLGKEIDHRLKVYFRVNSTMDRLIYRCLLGNMALLIIFNMMSLIPFSFVKHFFWGFWVVLGLFYSWPTRGKIIEETVSTNFGEFNFLDNFEKTILMLIGLLFVFSIPELPIYENSETLKLFLDPKEKIHPLFWNYLNFTFFPFAKFPKLYCLGWVMYFYTFGLGLYLMTFYAVLRYFLSRRLSILGVFAVLSSWSFAKILNKDFASSITTSFSVIWIWSLLWTSKSATYRIGLFMGLLSFWGMLINVNYMYLFPIHILFILFISLKEKTFWFKRQILKYVTLGVALILIVGLYSFEEWPSLAPFSFTEFLKEYGSYLDRKAFFNLSTIGVIAIIYFFMVESKKQILQIRFDHQKLKEIIIGIVALILTGMVFEENLIHHFSLVWIIAFLSLIPLEFIFQTISRLRSKRNLIYGLYILICLLDSHFEVRLKLFSKLFK